MRKTRMLTFSVLAAVAVAVILAAQSGVALADSAALLPGESPPVHPDSGFYIALFAWAAGAVALGAFCLWVVSLSTRATTAGDVRGGEERR